MSLWRTTPVTAETSWANPPRDLAKIATNHTEICKAPYLECDATKAVKAAVAKGENTLTLSLRLPDNIEAKPANFRKLRSSGRPRGQLQQRTRRPHRADHDGRRVHDREALHHREERQRHARRDGYQDPDVNDTGSGDWITGHDEVWRVGSTQTRTELEASGRYAPASMRASLQPNTLVDGATYAWKMRTSDDTADQSPWSDTCRFVVDKQAPTGTVTITSTDYPDDGRVARRGRPARRVPVRLHRHRHDCRLPVVEHPW